MARPCQKEGTLSNHNTEIALIKQYIVMFDREILDLRKQGRLNTTLLITNLVVIIGVLLEKIL